MERDFMGLNYKDTVVKEEALEDCKPVFSRSLEVRWPQSNGVEAFNHQQAGEIQTAYSTQLHQETKPAVPVILSSSFFRPHFCGAPINPQSLGGVPVAPHPVLPSTGSFFARATEPWHGLKATAAPGQLTIFYGGMVNVYDDISPEKAQAVMFLAGNGTFVAAANPPLPWSQAQVATPMTPAGDAGYMSQPINTQPCLAVSSPMSVSSHPVGLLTGGPTAIKDELAMGGSATPQVMSSLGQVMHSAIPQARKASLARFLEKRKERMMAMVPYRLNKKSPDCVASSDAVVVASDGR